MSGLQFIAAVQEGTMYVCREHVHLSRDRSRVVDENDPEAGWLLCAPGHEIPEDEARRWGLIGDEPAVMVGELVVPEAEDLVFDPLPEITTAVVSEPAESTTIAPPIMTPETKRAQSAKRPSRAKAKAGQ